MLKTNNPATWKLISNFEELANFNLAPYLAALSPFWHNSTEQEVDIDFVHCAINLVKHSLFLLHNKKFSALDTIKQIFIKSILKNGAKLHGKQIVSLS